MDCNGNKYMETLSVVIPAWSGTPELVEMTLNLAKQVKTMCDELVISEDGVYTRELHEVADIYLLHPRLGHGSNLNLGFRASTGEYVALLDSDIEIVSGDIRDLCVPGRVTSPYFRDQSHQGFFIVAPRWILIQNPPYDAGRGIGGHDVTVGAGEGIDNWIIELRAWSGDKLLPSDAVVYNHLSSRSYAQLRVSPYYKVDWATGKRVEDDIARHRARMLKDAKYYQEVVKNMPKEIDSGRHQQRLETDEEYRKYWLEG